VLHDVLLHAETESYNDKPMTDTAARAGLSKRRVLQQRLFRFC